MLASQSPIEFPALLFERDGPYYDYLQSLPSLFLELPASLPGAEIIDAANQRFLIRSVVGLTRLGGSWRRWWEDHGWGLPSYEFDLDIELMAPTPFDDTLRRVIANEDYLEALWVEDGGGADAPTDKAALAACRSVAEIIEHMEARETRGLSSKPKP